MLTVVVADLRTGRRIVPIPYSAVTVEGRRNTPEGLSVTLTLKDPLHRRLDLRSSAAVGKSILAVFDGDFCLGAGPVWSHEYDDDARRLSLESEGIWSLLDRRFVMPASVDTVPLLVPSGDEAGEPNPAVATTFVGKSWPQIVRGLLEQSMARPGGSLPLVFGPDGVGSHDKSYDAASFKTVGSALDDLTELENGPEIEFRPRLTADRQGIEFLVRVGDDVQPELSSKSVHRFDFTAAKRSVRKLTVKTSAEDMTSEAWATGGRQAAVALISRAASTNLIDAGYPRMESVSSAHSTVVEQPTLDSYAAEDLALGQLPTEFWSFEAQADKAPRLGTYGIGDYAELVLKNNAYGIPDGKHTRRIAGFSMSEGSRWVRITTDEVRYGG